MTRESVAAAAGWEHVARRVYRIGVEQLWRKPDGMWAVSLDNRTYHQWFNIPPERVPAWQREFGLEPSC